MALKRFISVALAGLMVVTSINTGSIKAYASSSEQELLAAHEQTEAVEETARTEQMEVDAAVESVPSDVDDEILPAEKIVPEEETVIDDDTPGDEEDIVTEDVTSESDTLVEDEIEEIPSESDSEDGILEKEDEACKLMDDSDVWGLYLDANGGTFPDGNSTYFYEYFELEWDRYLSQSKYKPYKQGKLFIGWYKEAAGINQLSSEDNPYLLREDCGIKKNDRIYAKYSEDYCTVTFVYGSGAAGDKGYYWDSDLMERLLQKTVKVQKGKKISSSPEARAYAGYSSYSDIRNEDRTYSFSQKWYSDKNRSGDYEYPYQVVDKVITQDCTFYAGYEKDQKIITIHSGADNAFFTQEVFGLNEVKVKQSTIKYLVADYNDYVWELYLPGLVEYDYLYNTDPRMGIEGAYLDEDCSEDKRINEDEDGYIAITKNISDIWIKWAPTHSVITFDANGGDTAYIRYKDYYTGEYSDKTQVAFSVHPGEYSEYHVGELKCNDSKWKFLGWSEDPKATEPDKTYVHYDDYDNDEHYTCVSKELKGNVNLYAVWNKNAYWTATFDAGEGYFEIEDESGKVHKEKSYSKRVEVWPGSDSVYVYPLIPKTDDDKLQFSGWTYNGEKTGGMGVEADHDGMVFTAVYETVYTVTLHADDEKRTHGGYLLVDDKKVVSEDLYGNKNISVRIPTPDTDKGSEWVFGGWYQDKACTILATSGDSYLCPEKDMYLYAKWIKACKVTFDAGEKGTVDANGQRTYEFTRAEGESIKDSYFYSVPKALPKDSKEVFVSWNTDPKFSPGGRLKINEVAEYVVTGDVVFYAEYKTAVEVTFVAEGGFISKADTSWTASVPLGESIGKWVPSVKDIDTKEKQQVFKGWSETQDGAVISNIYNYIAAKKTTLYARYTDCNVVTFHVGRDDVGAKLDGSTEPIRVLVPVGSPYQYFKSGYDYKTFYAPELSYDEENAKEKRVVPLREGMGEVGWTCKVDGKATGDIYFFGGARVYYVDADGTENKFGHRGFIPTGDMDFYVTWASPISVTFKLGGSDEFDPEKLKYEPSWLLSKDNKSVTISVPSGTRFEDIDAPTDYFIKTKTENYYFKWGYKNGKQVISPDKKITATTTITGEWIKTGDGGSGDELNYILHAGKGYFGTKDSVTGNGTFSPGRKELTITPSIDDDSLAFAGWSSTQNGTTADYGVQSFDSGVWNVTFPEDAADGVELWAIYAPAATITLDANGGYFSTDQNTYVDPDETVREVTSITLKPTVAPAAGGNVSLSVYNELIKHDGDRVFGGWTTNADGTGEKLILTSTDYWKDAYTPGTKPITVYAQWIDPLVPHTLTLSAKDMNLKVGEKNKDLGLIAKDAKGNTLDITKQDVDFIIQDISENRTAANMNSAVVSVSDDGKVNAIGAGKVKIYAECNGRRSNGVTVTVTEGPIEDVDAPISFDTGKYPAPVNITGKKDTTIKLDVNLSDQYSDKAVEWSTSDASVLSATPIEGTGGKEALLKVVKDVTATTLITVKAKITGAEDVEPATIQVSVNKVERAQAPEVNPKPAVLGDSEGTIIELSTKTADGTIYYTTDNKAPSIKVETIVEDGVEKTVVTPLGTTKKYTDAIVLGRKKDEQDTRDHLDDLGTITAITYREGYEPSNPDDCTYTYKIRKDNWGDINSDTIKGWFGGNSNEVPDGVWYVWNSKGGVKHIGGISKTGVETTIITENYSGDKITFSNEISVYHGTRKLIENRDYTISYKNNTNAFDVSGKSGAELRGAPVMSIKGKGIYNSTTDIYFTIEPEDMASSKDVAITSEKDVIVLSGPKVKVTGTSPVVTYKGKKLTRGKDYKLAYYRVEGGKEILVNEEELSKELLDAKGKTYKIVVVGLNNFKNAYGTKVKVTAIEKDPNVVQVSNLKIADAKGKTLLLKFDYTDKGQTLTDLQNLFNNSKGAEGAIAFVYNGRELLTYGKDYTIKIAEGSDFKTPGKQNFVIAGKPDKAVTEEDPKVYVGEKTVTATITARSTINKAKVAGLKTTVEYLGRDFTNADLDSAKTGALFNAADKNLHDDWKKVTLYTGSGKNIEAVNPDDYEVEAFSSGAVGKFNIVFKAKNGGTGTLKKTVTIKAANLSKANLDKLGAALLINVPTTPTFVKSGAKPAVEAKISYGKGYTVTLRQGIDYTVTYKNNTKVFDVIQNWNDAKAMKSAPTVTVKGIGNYAGVGASQAFTIEPADPSQIDVFVKDVVYNKSKSGKSGYFLAAPKLLDDGKAVSIGKKKDVEYQDTKKKYTCRYDADTVLEDGSRKSANDIVGAKDKVPAGTVLRVDVPVKLSASSPYNNTGVDTTATLKGYYRVVSADIGKARITVKDQNKLMVNNAEAIKLTKADIQVGIGNAELTADDYDIVSITNNTGVGNMTVTIAGKGNYGGTKSQTFKIKAKSMK